VPPEEQKLVSPSPGEKTELRLPRRNQKLDALRGIAILLVLGSHYNYFSVWTRIGWTGVDLFFVLSGFLISGLLFSDYQRHGTINLKRFWIRRGFKIYPPFYALIGFTVILFLFQRKPIPASIVSDLFFVQNYFPRLWDHEWSLAVEEHFYLALPLLLILMIRLSKRKDDPFRAIPAISIILAIACLALRQRASLHGAAPRETMFPTHLRVDSLFAGVALGYYKHFRSDQFKQAPQIFLWVAGAVFLLPVFLMATAQTFMTTIFTFAFLGFGCITMAVVNQMPSRNPATIILAWIGYYSYSIYLWHAPLASLFEHEFHATLITFTVYGVLCIGVGFAMAGLVERPALNLRDKWFPSLGRALSPSGGDLPVPASAEVIKK
jgi:peptidoglycan/LPS O-acetylase OafA/YrhL